jgi:phage antirepressor YoqD-like protein
MNSLSIQNQQTMLSTEIAALTKKRHGDVMRDIRVIIEQLEDNANLRCGFILTEYKADNGKKEPCYQLDYESTTLVLTGYDAVARMKVIKRWRELEQQITKPIDPMQVLNDPAAMRGLLLTYAETVIEKDKVIAEQAPKVAALARLSGSEGSLCVRDTATTLGIKPSKLSKWMEANKWAYRRAGKNKDLIPCSPRIQSGVLEYEPTLIPLDNGSSITKLQMRVTPKGLTKLAQIFSETGAITTGETAHA